MPHVCKEARISKGTFYHHFESKRALFLALVEGWPHATDNAIEASKGKTDPESFVQMTEALPYFYETACEGLPMFLEFWLQASRDKKIWRQALLLNHVTISISHR